MAEPRYGYNAQGTWTLLQPGEEEWNANLDSVLSRMYGNDNTSLMGNYYNAGGNISGIGAGGLISASGATPQGTSAKDIVYEYTRPRTEAEQLASRRGQEEWRNMEMNSSHWNPNDANAYAIQNTPLTTDSNRVSNQNQWSNWASTNNYIAPVTTNQQRENTGQTPGYFSATNTTTSTNPHANTVQNGGLTNSSTSPYLARMSNSQMAYSGAPRYNDIAPSTGQQSNTGLTEATKMPQLGTPTRQGSVDFSKALWR
jgi:hypothetical protein